MPKRRKEISQDLSNILINVVPNVFIRCLKNYNKTTCVDDLNRFQEDHFFEELNKRLNGYNTNNKIKTYQDLMRFEIEWYEQGGCCPSFTYEDIFNLRTKEGKINFIVGFFIDDILKNYLIRFNWKESDILNLLTDVKKCIYG